MCWFQHLQAAKHEKYYRSTRKKNKKFTKINKRYLTVNMWAAKRQVQCNLFQKVFQNMEEIYFETVQAGPGSSVGIGTCYGLHGPGSNLGGDEIFRPFRPALGPTQPPVKRVRGLSRR